ncbi:MAG: hypothetical protein BCS36_07680 [Desulfovibrio sp. MES5]|nr:MAG: hypothetical protein BCS36_07680 [Desulfovibrio sp. MES5]
MANHNNSSLIPLFQQEEWRLFHFLPVHRLTPYPAATLAAGSCCTPTAFFLGCVPSVWHSCVCLAFPQSACCQFAVSLLLGGNSSLAVFGGG